ncbi:MAG: site-specific tyrosine recombinase/integron integrase [Fidelibacterota bacterium]
MDSSYIYITDFINFTEKEKGYSAHTAKSYRHDLNRFHSFMTSYLGKSAWLVEDVDKQTIRHFLGKEFEAGFASKTVARRLATIKSFFKYLLSNNIINVNPAAEVRTPKTPKSLPAFISEKMIGELMNIPDLSTIAGYRDKAILELFYSTGMRLSELVGLNFGDFQFDDKLVRVFGKGKKERLIPFGNYAKISLENYWQKRGMSIRTAERTEPCFVNAKNKRISIRTVQRRVKKYIQQIAEGSSLGPHTLRHSFATHMLERGADIRALKDLLGHSSLSSTQIYTHIQPEKMKEIYKQAHPHSE